MQKVLANKTQSRPAKKFNLAQLLPQLNLASFLNWPIKVMQAHICFAMKDKITVTVMTFQSESVSKCCAEFQCLISLQTHVSITQIELPGLNFMPQRYLKQHAQTIQVVVDVEVGILFTELTKNTCRDSNLIYIPLCTSHKHNQKTNIMQSFENPDPIEWKSQGSRTQSTPPGC